MRNRNKDRAALLCTLGLDPKDSAAWTVKWNSLKKNAAKESKIVLLSFEDYVRLAVEAGLKTPSEIGPKLGMYQLARPSDSGPYSIGNCRFVTREQNMLELRLNGGTARMASSKTGKTKENDQSVAAMARTKTGRTKANHPGVAKMALKKAGTTFNKETRKYEKTCNDSKDFSNSTDPGC